MKYIREEPLKVKINKLGEITYINIWTKDGKFYQVKDAPTPSADNQ